MPFEPGTVVGRYEIESLIAVGGMGEVYRARDHELHRSVALKFLSQEFNSKPDRLNRFIQEARAASALNHPNIVTVHEIGRLEDRDKLPFMATELIDGVTLRDYARKPIKLREMLDIAIQIASALVAAHEAGIVHRDIKPDNIMVRRDGYVKVLDFGLAKPIETLFGSGESEAQTMALVKTERGALMGTVSYMSPEQARGAELDARTDIWSLGAVLYELVTGHTPFSGKTPSHTIVSIIEDEPPEMTATIGDVPQALEWMVVEALTKDREERTQTAREMLSKLRRLKQRVESGAELDLSLAPSAGRSSGSGAVSRESGRGRTSVQPGTTARSGSELAYSSGNVSSAEFIAGRIHAHRKIFLLAGVLFVLAVGAVAFGLYRWSSRPAVTPGAIKISRLTNDGNSGLGVISPDGKYVAHVYRQGDKQAIVLRQTVATSSREIIPATDGYFLGLTFSRDSNYLYYVKGERGSNVRALYQVPLLGGDSRQLLFDVDSEITQSPDGKKIAFIRGYFKEKEKALFVVNADGSGEERLTTRRAPEFNAMDHPAWSPDGKRIAFVVSGDDDQGYFHHIYEIGVEDRVERKISPDRWRNITSIAWLSDGSGVLAVARDRAAIAGSPMQIWRITYPGGEPQRITLDINYYTELSLAGDSKVLVAGANAITSGIVIAEGADSNRTREILARNFSALSGLSWTSDGRLLYSSAQRENRDIWVVNADGSGQKQLTFDPAGDMYPTGSPDGRYIAFLSNRGNRWSIWRMNPDGSNAIELVRTDGENHAPQFSPDGRWVFYSADTGGRQVIWKISIDGGAAVKINDQEMHSLSVSPDGKLAAYYHRPPEFNAPMQVQIASTENGAVVQTLPVLGDGSKLTFSPDGKSIDYIETRAGVSNLMRMPLDGGKPRQLTDWKSDLTFWFAWSPDGKQLACVRGTNVKDLILMEDLNLVQ